MLGGGAVIFGYYVDDPRPFGVVDFDSEGKAISIEEKPAYPKSNFIVPGLYFYDNQVVSIVQELQASMDREISITDVNNVYLQNDELNVVLLEEQYLLSGSSYLGQAKIGANRTLRAGSYLGQGKLGANNSF